MKIFSERGAERWGSERRVHVRSGGGSVRGRRWVTMALLVAACLAMITGARAQDGDGNMSDNEGDGGGGCDRGSSTSAPSSSDNDSGKAMAAKKDAAPSTTAPTPRAARRPSFPLYAATAEVGEAGPDAPHLPHRAPST
jgi:hypothetical protein